MGKNNRTKSYKFKGSKIEGYIMFKNSWPCSCSDETWKDEKLHVNFWFSSKQYLTS
jgi:hypothetical protein